MLTHEYTVLQENLFFSIMKSGIRTISSDVYVSFMDNPRHQFLTRFWSRRTAQWYTKGNEWNSSDLEEIYQDQPLALSMTPSGEVLSAQSTPSFIIRLLDALNVERDQMVLEIGFASGWLSSMACSLVGDHGIVVGTEIDETTTLAFPRIQARCPINFRPVFGDLDSIKLSSFDLLISTSSGCLPKNLSSLLSNNARFSLALTLPGGGDRTVIFQRDGSLAYPVRSEYSRSVSGRGGLSIKSGFDSIKSPTFLYKKSSDPEVNMPAKFYEGSNRILNFVRFREYLAASDNRFCLFMVSDENRKLNPASSFGLYDPVSGSAAYLTQNSVCGSSSENLINVIERHLCDFLEITERGNELLPLLYFDENTTKTGGATQAVIMYVGTKLPGIVS